MTAQELFSSKGYAVSDNRSQNWKNINKAMQNGIEINLSKNGFFFGKKEKNVRMSLKYNGLVSHFECKSFIENGGDSKVVGDVVVNAIALFLKAIRKRNATTGGTFSFNSTPCKCRKCRGTGFVPHFMHYCEGICFECMGFGYR